MNDTEKREVQTNTQTEQQPQKRKRRKILRMPAVSAAAVFFSMLGIIAALSVTSAVLASKLGKAEETLAEEPAVQAYVPIVNDRVYDFYSEDDIIFTDDYGYGQIWLPALTNVPKCGYDYSGLKLEENGRYTYSENGEVVSKTGIDVSYHQGEIDWQKVAADGIDFAILRVGYRGYETGLLNLDSRFDEYIKGALNAGLEVGVYFYSQAINTDEAIAEANFVMEHIRGYKVTYPVVYDWEFSDSGNSRTNGISPYAVTECAAAFCDTVADGGYRPMVYSSRRFALFKFDMRKLANYDFWFAEYKDGHNEPSYPYDFKIWQYASDGRVDGINGEVDLNICLNEKYGTIPNS